MSGNMKPIPGMPGYFATDTGEIWSAARKVFRKLRPEITKGGYGRVNTKVRRDLVHRLVCLTFNGPPASDELEVRHLNGNPRDNRPENLCWGTAKENAADRHLHGRDGFTVHPESCPRGEKSHNAVLTAEDVIVIRERAATGETYTRLAEEFGVSKRNVRSIVAGITWAHVGGPRCGPRPEIHIGEDHGMARLTVDTVRAIRAMASAGTSQREIAAHFGVGQSSIGRVVRRESWTHVEGT